MLRETAPALSTQQLDLMFGTSALALPARAEGTTDLAYYRAFIRDRLSKPDFYYVFGPSLFQILDVYTRRRAGGYLRDTLVEAGNAKGKYHFNKRIGDCGGKDLVQIEPWWDQGQKLTICRDSVREEVTSDPATGFTCHMAATWPGNPCGCGPHLLYCAPPWMGSHTSLLPVYTDEVLRTLQYVVENHKPYKSLFQMNETMRSSMAEYWYARSAFLDGAPLAMPRVVDASSLTDFKLRPRRPEHTAGLLTTVYYLYNENARRVAVQNIWNDLLCVGWKATGVDAHTLFDMFKDVPDLRGSVNVQLTETPGCRNCHSRLEYGTLAFADFTPGIRGSRYEPGAPRTTRFYVNGADDLRAEGPATPAWLGEQLVSQPEFPNCAVRKVTDFVYQGQAVPKPAFEALVERFRANDDLGELIEDAVMYRAFGSFPATKGM